MALRKSCTVGRAGPISRAMVAVGSPLPTPRNNRMACAGRGIFQKGDPKLLGFAILGAINWTVRWFSPQGPLSAQEIGEAFAEYLVQGLRFKSGQGRPRNDGVAGGRGSWTCVSSR